MDRIRQAILDWIREDAGAAIKLSVTPEQVNKLRGRIIANQPGCHAATASHFRHKLVPVEAVQWTGENDKAVFDFLNWRNASQDEHGLRLHTPSGSRQVEVGDWIIKDANGAFHPCKDNDFREAYEPVSTEKS